MWPPWCLDTGGITQHSLCREALSPVQGSISLLWPWSQRQILTSSTKYNQLLGECLEWTLILGRKYYFYRLPPYRHQKWVNLTEPESCSHKNVSYMVFTTEEYSFPGSNISALKNWQLFLIIFYFYFCSRLSKLLLRTVALLHGFFFFPRTAAGQWLIP